MHTLYKLTFKSGKCYIGQTTRKVQTRFTQHRADVNRGSKLPVHCAWRVHGEPDLQVIGSFDTHEELHQAEIEAIASHNTLTPNGYNVGFGGETAPSKNPEVAKKIAEKATGRKIADTSSLTNALKVRWQDEGSRERMLEGMRKGWTEERRQAARERINARWEKRRSEGWTMPDSTKDKLKKKVVSDEARKKMSESAKKRKRDPVSDETRKKLSARAKEAWADREITEKRLAAMKDGKERGKSNMSEAAARTWQNPEVRERRIAAIKAAKENKRNQTD